MSARASMSWIRTAGGMSILKTNLCHPTQHGGSNERRNKSKQAIYPLVG
jgi:hypothetical protein